MSGLIAYRFSSNELSKMGWLKGLFADNSFLIERFPEVYYDTFDNARKVYPNLERNQKEDTPDYLGVYIYSFGDKICKEQCK